MAIWRGHDGQVRAWENRCPHRGMRLSFGFVRENTLTCLYHGWRYDGSGSCVFIPAHPALTPPKTIKTQVFACAERNGLIWVAPEKVSGHPPAVEGKWIECRTIEIDAPAKKVRDAFSAALFPPFSGIARSSDPADHDAIDHSERGTGRNVAHAVRLVSQALVHIRSNSEEVVCGIQPASYDQTFVHVLFSITSQAIDQSEARLRFARWAKRLRRFLETEDIFDDGHHSQSAA